MRLLLLLLVCLALPAYAETMTAQADEKNYVTLYEKPCTATAVLKHVKPGSANRLQRADMMYQGKPYKACWVGAPDGNVYVVDEAGELSRIPMMAFEVGGPGARM